jgi:hypothetical protein
MATALPVRWNHTLITLIPLSALTTVAGRRERELPVVLAACQGVKSRYDGDWGKKGVRTIFIDRAERDG